MEYGLTDIQEYYANTGALKRAAQARFCDWTALAGGRLAAGWFAYDSVPAVAWLH